MKLDRRSLRTKVARRIFLLFMVCALLPVGALATVSLFSVSRQLRDHGRDRLAESTKSHGMVVYDRLRSAEASLALVAATLGSDPSEHTLAANPERFDAVMLVAEATESALLGAPFAVPALSDDARQHLDSGASVVMTSPEDGRAPRVLMTVGVNTPEGVVRWIVGSIDPDYLWGLDGLPATTVLHVLDEDGRLLTSSGSVDGTFLDDVARRLAESSVGRLERRDGSADYLSSYWSLFLQPRFHAAGWTFILSEPLAYVQGPISEFRNWFFWITLTSIWVVALLSLIQIRRNLVPLEALREGTRQIAAQEFDARVTVTSEDEFEELAESFNSMAGRLGKQFSALTTINEIDKAVLSKLTTGEVVSAALERIPELLRCDAVSVGLLDREGRQATVHVRVASAYSTVEIDEATIEPEDASRLQGADGYLHERCSQVDGSDRAPSTSGYLRPLAALGMRVFVTLPLRGTTGAVVGFVSLGMLRDRALDDQDVRHVRQVADQVSVALANAQLVETLDRLTWGTLRALARAIDAKSPWTAGHSERVTEMALRIGRVFNLPADQLDVLHRGGLLHDIGKIGVPAEILDKNGRLSDAEMGKMRDHVTIGAAILEPLESFADALPIVLEHHEWFNGNGYPNGLSGEQLSFGGRIYAVADVFDAITSARPYRQPMPRDEAVALITRGSGAQFDPTVVDAFLKVMAADDSISGLEAAAVGPDVHAPLPTTTDPVQAAMPA